jgi:hypothetical protein
MLVQDNQEIADGFLVSQDVILAIIVQGYIGVPQYSQ